MNDVFVGEELRVKIDHAISVVARAVVGTMGPNGRYSVLDAGGRPKVTKDGVSVARAIAFNDRTENMVAQIITQAAIKTDDQCGDGTTTTVFLTELFYSKFKDDISFITKRRLNELTDWAIERIESYSVDPTADKTLLRSLGLTSANNEAQIVDQIMSIYDLVTGVPEITFHRGVEARDLVEVNPSLAFHGGYADPSFSYNGAGAPVLLDSAQIVVFDCALRELTREQIERFRAVFKTQYAGIKDTSIVILAKQFDRTMLEFFSALNQSEFCKANKLRILPVRITAIGTGGSGIIADIVTVLNEGGLYPSVSFDSWLDSDVATHQVSNIEVGVSRFKILPNDDAKQRIQERVGAIRKQIDELPLEQRIGATASILRRRIGNLEGGQVSVLVGGETEADIQERLDRYVDVDKALKSAILNGVIPGIGSTPYRVGKLMLEAFPGDVIAQKFADVLMAQQNHLITGKVEEGKFINLATGAVGQSAGEIGVWDAKLALVTALRAGVRTAVILGSLDSSILSINTGSVR